MLTPCMVRHVIYILHLYSGVHTLMYAQLISTTRRVIATFYNIVMSRSSFDRKYVDCHAFANHVIHAHDSDHVHMPINAQDCQPQVCAH